MHVLFALSFVLVLCAASRVVLLVRCPDFGSGGSSTRLRQVRYEREQGQSFHGCYFALKNPLGAHPTATAPEFGAIP
jgi:hypothetical protein